MAKTSRHKKDDDDEEEDQNEKEQEDVSEDEEKRIRREKKVKKMIATWSETDNKIKLVNKEVKKLKDAKKEMEEQVLELLEKTGLEEHKFAIKTGDTKKSIYRAKSTTKGGLKEELVRNAIMEVVQKDKVADKVIQIIDDKREVKERYYLKATSAKD